MGAAFLALAALGPYLAQASDTITVEMKDLGFAPATFRARVGDTVEWVNRDFVAHTATARNGDWDVTIPAQSSRRVLIKRPGTVVYYCRFHPNMTGEAQIEPTSSQ